MAKEGVLKAETRTLAGTAPSRRMRKEGWLPGVISLEKGGSRVVRLNQHDFEQMLLRHRSESLILDVSVDSEDPRKMLLKEVQHNPLSGRPLHVDFIEISMTRKMRVSIAIRLTGDPIGVTQEGGVLEQPLRSIEVECLPTDLVEEIALDVSQLKLGHSILVRDLTLDAKFTVQTPGDIAVAAVSAPRVEEEVKPEEAAATAEPELIGAKEKDEAAAEEGAESKDKKGKEKPEAEKAKEKTEKEKPKEKAKK